MHVDRPVLATLLLAAGTFLAAQPGAPPPPRAAAPVRVMPQAPQPRPGAPLTGWTVVLDPGHGGDDPGVQAGELREGQLTAAIASQAAAALIAQGARVVFTREADAGATPDARATAANRAHGHAFISLHFNRALRPAAAGAEVYTHLGRANEPDQPDGGDAGPVRLALIPWDRVQDRHAAATERLAAHLADALNTRIPTSARPRQRVPLRTLAGVDMPAVLIELAYLSNPEQAASAATPEFQSSVAEALADAVLAFRHGAGGPH